jgi:uncharacterized LabA/DUF88 family protein
LSEERLKIAVFVDFDNIEIGVKKTLSRHFDIGTVLEAIKERGEVVTKIAYGDWKHASDYSRAMTQHAVHMIQRNLTPGGDKNGADITLALDALEMAFTRSHINAFVIVGGDSDFIALVEKLKQYDKMVFVVGGRSFTSSILQKNCHEFIAYENLIGLQPAARKSAGRAPAVSTAQLREALPPLRRALEILADREVSPQLGLLKSTLLQLDSTFSERDYGAASFREFIQKMANAGFVNLKHVDRSLLVELKDAETAAAPVAQIEKVARAPVIARETALPEVEPEAIPPAPHEPVAPPPAAAGAVSAIRQILEQLGSKPHWPMYLRSFKHFLRSADATFDERRFGFSNIHDLARQAQRDGLLRIERNRQGILRIYPGEQYPQAPPEKPPMEETMPAEAVDQEHVEPGIADAPPPSEPLVETVAKPSAETQLEEQLGALPSAAAEERPKRRRAAAAAPSASRHRRTPARKPRATKKNAETR